MNLISIISGDDACPKPGDDPPSVCQVPDHRNPTERFPNRENIPGDYFIISAPGDMNLKDADDPLGPEVVTAVEISDYIIFLPDLLDGTMVPIIGEGWYRQAGLTGEGVSAALVSFDDTTTNIKGTNVQVWNSQADVVIQNLGQDADLLNGRVTDVEAKALANETQIGVNAGAIGQNASDIGNNAAAIGQNASDITDLGTTKVDRQDMLRTGTRLDIFNVRVS